MEAAAMSSKVSLSQPVEQGLEVEAKTIAEHLDGLDERIRELRHREIHELVQQGRDRFGQTLRRASQWFRERRLERATYRELAALDDRMLRDLGLSRGELHYVARRAVATPGDLERPILESPQLKLQPLRLVNCETSERQESRAA
jgi:uncharacterized protein YjiS (DUF1127 family)